MPKSFPKEAFQKCPEILPTCCNMGSAYGPPERSCKRSTLREIPMFVKKSAPGHHLPPLVYFRERSFLTQRACVWSSKVCWAFTTCHWAKQGEKRLLALQDLGSPWGNEARIPKQLVTNVRSRLYREGLGKAIWRSSSLGRWEAEMSPQCSMENGQLTSDYYFKDLKLFQTALTASKHLPEHKARSLTETWGTQMCGFFYI